MIITGAAASLAACGGSDYRVVHQASPNPLAGARAFGIAPLTVNGHPPADDDEKELAKCYAEKLHDKAGDLGVVAGSGPFVVQPIVTRYEDVAPYIYVGPAGGYEEFPPAAEPEWRSRLVGRVR